MSDPSSPKRRKVSSNDSSPTATDIATLLEEWLGVGGTATTPPPALTTSTTTTTTLLPKTKIRQDLYKLQELFDAVGFRTSIVQSPRLAVSLYKDSCVMEDETNDDKINSDGDTNQLLVRQQQQQRDYLLTMLGLHPDQDAREQYYKSSGICDQYCLHQFLARLKLVRRKAMQDDAVQAWIEQHTSTTTTSTTITSASDIQQFKGLMLRADPKLRLEQLDHELDRLRWSNCTLSNALLQQLLDGYHGCIVKDVFFKTSHVAKYERLTFYLYDPDVDEIKPTSNFVLLPDLSRALQQTQEQKSSSSSKVSSSTSSEQKGVMAIVQDMMTTFWSHLLRHGGYYASTTMKEQLSPALERYFLSGLRQDPNIPLKLNAHFEPCEPVSLYLWGKAGAGKSSFVRHVPAAIQSAVETHADPEMLVRFVKQALNKPYKDLCLELELRPNNNDLSVMSIIQSRKCTMAQSKPGLVVIDLEEMPQYFEELGDQHDPNQIQVCQLVSQRFGGKKGHYDATKKAPRNSEKRGIGNDASLITLFTSNYTLAQPSQEALQRLPMFQHLTAVEMTAISGTDRRNFAHAYLLQSITDRLQASAQPLQAELKTIDMPLGEGDSRPLVRHLRMLAYYASTVIFADGGGLSASNSSTYEVSVAQQGNTCQVTVGCKPSLELHVGTLDNLFPVKFQVLDPRTLQVMNVFRAKVQLPEESYAELSTILDFWLGGVLAPAVILSKDKHVVESLIAAVAETLTSGGVQCIADVEAGPYKMMKSLYDPRDTPNLRDDILKLGGGRRTKSGVGSSTLCGMSIMCPTADAQLCIREMVEDSPSMTAFSSDKSALYKSGLLFAVHVGGGEITPELRSRASLIL